jgi:hypothetical protein
MTGAILRTDATTLRKGVASKAREFLATLPSGGYERKAMKILRNIIGTAGLIYAGYVLVVSMKDVRRYIRISTM